MAVVSRNILTSFFQSGDKPTALQFATLIDSMINYPDDRKLLGLKNYDPAQLYIPGDTAVANSSVYQAVNQTTGTFKPADWNKIAGFIPGAVIYKGTWDADTNDPDLLTIPKVAGDYYVVSVEGDTDLNGITDWSVGDWAIYNGVVWEKIDNTDGVTGAENIDTVGVGIFEGKNGTVLQFKKLINTDASVYLIENPKSIDIGIQFDDAGVSPSRAWSSSKINAGLETKETANPNIQAHIADMNNPHQTTKLQLGLGNVENTKVNFSAITDPAVTDDSAAGYSVGSTWINTINGKDFVCLDASVAAAVWVELTPNPDIQAHIANMNNPHNVTSAQVGLGNVPNTKVNFSAPVDPGASNDDSQGYSIGSVWLNTSSQREFTCFDAATNAAVWIELTPNPNIQAHIADMNNPHNVTQEQVGLGNVNNTSDLDKPVSIAQGAADAAVLATANAYSDSLVIGFLNDRGNYDASGNTFPVTGGSGTGGAVNKGDLWTISVAGTLGGENVAVGDVIRALVNNPGQTGTNWAISQTNIGYVAENVANKISDFSAPLTNVQYPGALAVFEQLSTKEPVITPSGSDADFWSGTKVFLNFGTAARNTLLTGLSLVTNQVISATDSVVQAFGYLQKQISDNLTTLSNHITNTSNPHNVTKAQVGLDNADNTSDINKPVSTAQAAADAVVLSTANAYSDSLVVGLLDDRGNYNASSNAFPSTGGSGPGGDILKGDLWTISVAGTLGGQVVEPGDLVRALTNDPAQNASHWAITQNNIGYVAENVANKVTTLVGATDTKYPSAKLVLDQLALKEGTITAGTSTQYWRGDKTFQTLDKTAVGLSNVDNTSDANKPISTAQAAALALKEATITAGTTSQYWRGDKTFQTLDKTAVGLSNVDNTSDANKPVSTAQATSIATKEPIIAASGNVGDFWNGTKTFVSFGNTVRATALTGLSLATSQPIAATDTVIQAFGYLQKQMTDGGTTLSGHISNFSNPHHVSKEQIGLLNVQNIKVNLAATADPGPGNDVNQGYAVGSTWVNITNNRAFVAVNVASTAAVWKEITNDIFGNDYQAVQSTSPGMAFLSANFQSYPSNGSPMILSTTGMAAGKYRITWSCLINSNKKRCQFQLKNTGTALPQSTTVIDLTPNTTNDQIPVGWTDDIVLDGLTTPVFVVQFKPVANGDIINISRARIELQRISF